MSEDDNGVSIELTQKEFMRLHNIYKKLLNEKGLTKEAYDFDMFMREAFALFLKKITYDNVEHHCCRNSPAKT